MPPVQDRAMVPVTWPGGYPLNRRCVQGLIPAGLLSLYLKGLTLSRPTNCRVEMLTKGCFRRAFVITPGVPPRVHPRRRSYQRIPHRGD